jgi:general secretion pathway protein E
VAEPALPELVEQLGLRRFATEPEIMVYRPKGCAQCNDSGYYGRTGLIETLQITDSIRRLILRRVEAMELMRAAIDEGMQTMYDDGMRKALAGETTIEEVLRVTRDV